MPRTKQAVQHLVGVLRFCVPRQLTWEQKGREAERRFDRLWMPATASMMAFRAMETPTITTHELAHRLLNAENVDLEVLITRANENAFSGKVVGLSDDVPGLLYVEEDSDA